MKKTTPSSTVHTTVHPKSAAVSRLILAAAMLAGLLLLTCPPKTGPKNKW